MEIELLAQLDTPTLVKIAERFSVPQGNCREELLSNLFKRYCDVEPFLRFTYVKQLGREGKDGRTFLALDSSGQEVAVKLFRKNKRAEKIEQEVSMQRLAAAHGIAPRVLEFSKHGRYIAMEKLDVNLFDRFRLQNGTLSPDEEHAILKVFQELDAAGVFHADPNPLNFMKRGDTWYAIDFGFAVPMNQKHRAQYGDAPNMTLMPREMVKKFKRIYAQARLPVLEAYVARQNLSKKK